MTTTYDELKCEVCGRRIKDTPLFRANPTGEKGRWRCEACLSEPPSDAVLAVTDSIQLGVWPGPDDQPMSLVEHITTRERDAT